MSRRIFAALALLVLLTAIAAAAAALDVDGGTIQAFVLDVDFPTRTPGGLGGTKLKGYKTAEGSRVGQGWQEHHQGLVRGEVCVENKGDEPTENLQINDVVQAKKRGRDSYSDLTSMQVDVSQKPVLDPGERHCYPYQIQFDTQDGAKYRNLAIITITNYRDHLGSRFGIQVKKGFSLDDDHDDGDHDDGDQDDGDQDDDGDHDDNGDQDDGDNSDDDHDDGHDGDHEDDDDD